MLSPEEFQRSFARSRCWVELSESRLRHNLREIRKKVPASSSLLAVVKADAYGHGAPWVARLALDEGARYLAVACLEEALELRRAGIRAPILLLSASPAAAAPILCQEGLTQALCSPEEARAYLAARRTQDPPLKVHIKLDTGMARLGWSVREEEAERAYREILEISRLEAVDCEGVFTHFAEADSEDASYHELQFSRFRKAVETLRGEGLALPIAHCANSATIVRHPEMAMDMVRAGIILYGGRDGDFMKEMIDLRPVMCLKSRISALRELAAGESVSYGRIFTTAKPMRIGVIECGYADGFPRILSGKALISLHGKQVPQIGRICMDRMMLDLDAVPEAKIGDEVILLGGEEGNFVDPDEQAERAGSISYELFCAVSRRVPRVHVS